MNEGDYVGFSAGGVDVGLDAGGHVAGMTGPMSFWNVPDVLERLAELLDAGWSLDTPVRKAGGGRMIATVRDPDGNVVEFWSQDMARYAEGARADGRPGTFENP